MINIKKLFNKAERGLRKEKVKVTRDGKTFYREQMVGRKEGEKRPPAKRTAESLEREKIHKEKMLKLKQKTAESREKIKEFKQKSIDLEEEKNKEAPEVIKIKEKIKNLKIEIKKVKIETKKIEDKIISEEL